MRTQTVELIGILMLAIGFPLSAIGLAFGRTKRIFHLAPFVYALAMFYILSIIGGWPTFDPLVALLFGAGYYLLAWVFIRFGQR